MSPRYGHTEPEQKLHDRRCAIMGTEISKSPSHDDSVTITCPACGGAFVPIGKQLWCSKACRSRGYRHRQRSDTPPVVLQAPMPRRTFTVYQCDSCDARALGEQRCDNCGTFMRGIGFGGLCPCCDQPVAAIELLPDATEARA